MSTENNRISSESKNSVDHSHNKYSMLIENDEERSFDAQSLPYKDEKIPRKSEDFQSKSEDSPLKIKDISSKSASDKHSTKDLPLNDTAVIRQPSVQITTLYFILSHITLY